MENKPRGLRHIPVSQLREASFAWRRARYVPWTFAFFRPDESIYDRVDDLIDEVERLRQTIVDLGGKP